MTIGLTSDMFLTALALGNFAAGGSIGAAADTVDKFACIQIAQTTAGQTVTIPSPTITTAGRLCILQNTGSQSVTAVGAAIAAGAAAIITWNGAAWARVA
jgi:hypothetical protein